MGAVWCSGSTLGSQLRGAGFESWAQWKIYGWFFVNPRPCPPSSEWVPGIIWGLWPVSREGKPVVTQRLAHRPCVGDNGSNHPTHHRLQGSMRRRWAPRPHAATAYAPNLTYFDLFPLISYFNLKVPLSCTEIMQCLNGTMVYYKSYIKDDFLHTNHKQD